MIVTMVKYSSFDAYIVLSKFHSRTRRVLVGRPPYKNDGADRRIFKGTLKKYEKAVLLVRVTFN